MSEEAAPGGFYGALPVFRVEDVTTTAEYYRDVLGFEDRLHLRRAAALRQRLAR
jgi:hypothetical protein